MFWHNISAAYEHRDGNAFNITLQAMPLGGKLMRRSYDDEPPKETNGVAGSKSKQQSRWRISVAASKNSVRLWSSLSTR